MVGCGEREEEVLEAMQRLRDAEVDVLTIGQYLRPSEKHAPLIRYVEPAEFDRYREAGMAMGFKHVASGPLVRSSYRAAEAFLKGILRGEAATSATTGVLDSNADAAAGVPGFTDSYGKKPRRLTVVT